MANNVQININAQDNASSAIRKVTSSLSEIGKTAIGFSLATVGIEGLAAAFDTAKDALIGYNDKLEQATIAYTTLLGSGGAANQFISDLQKFAERSPFNFQDVNDAATKMIGFGFAAKDVLPTIEAVGNALSGLGKNDKDVFSRIMLAIGQIQTKGKASAEELRQLAEAGIPAYSILADKLKLTGDQVAEIGKQGISANDAIKALVDGMNERFPNMMKKQNDTWTGIINGIKETALRVSAEISSGIFNGLKQSASHVRDWVDEVGKALDSGGLAGALTQMFGTKWAERVWQAISVVEEFGSSAANVAGVVYKVFEPIAGLFTDIALIVTDNVLGAFNSFASIASEHMDLVKSAEGAENFV